MGIAVSVFWVVFGLLYILYQAFKEHPSDTINGVVIFAILFGGILTYTLLYRWMLEENVVLGSVFALGGIGIFIALIIRSCIKDKKKNDEKVAKIRAEREECRSRLTDKDFEKTAIRMGYGILESSWNYWKREPYYSQTVEMAVTVRLIEEAKARKEAWKQ